MEDMQSSLQNMMSRLELRVTMARVAGGMIESHAFSDALKALKKEYDETSMISVDSYNKWRGFLPQETQRELRDLVVYPAIEISQHNLINEPPPPGKDCYMLNHYLAFSRESRMVYCWRQKKWDHVDLTKLQGRIFGYLCNAKNMPEKMPTLISLAQAMAAGVKLTDEKLRSRASSMWNTIEKMNKKFSAFGIGDIIVPTVGDRWCIDAKYFSHMP